MKTLNELKPGDTIALIEPAGKLDSKQIDQAADHLRNLGFFVVRYSKPKTKHSYFSAKDEDRAREWMWAFTEPGIKCVWACRGGYGSVRLLPHLDWNKISRAPARIFLGYSDLTFMHQVIQNRLKWPSFHGPLFGHLDRRGIKNALVQISHDHFSQPQKFSEVKILRSGSAKGTLVGGNLSLLCTAGLAELPRRPIILAIEDIHEDHYRLDRMVWNLIQAGYDHYVRGIIVGTLTACGEKDRKQFPLRIFEQSLMRLTKGPIWMGARFGHGLKGRQRVLALGQDVQMAGRALRYLRNPFRSSV